MARHVRDPKLDTRSARSKLVQRREPYWRTIAGGLSIGYRKGASGGTWIARHYSTGQGRQYRSIGAADDVADADSVHVLSFDQAQDLARKWLGNLARDHGPRLGPYTVNNAVDDYLAHLENDGRGAHAVTDARSRVEAFIRPALGRLDIAALTTERLRDWRDSLAKTPARVRTSKGCAQEHRQIGEDGRRARRATANRTWTVLRAALNHAFHNGKVESDIAWRRVKPFGGVHSARIRYLTVAEAKRLVNACDPDFRPLVQAALMTGARYSELAQLIASDFNPDVGTIGIAQSKSGKPRHVILNTEGRDFFRQLCAGRPGGDLLFRRDDGEPWGRSHQFRPMHEACRIAKVVAIGFHGLRHTWASLSVMSGMPLMVVAKNMGHSDTRMVEKHYGHLAPSYVVDAVREHAPTFGFRPDKRITPIR